MYPRPSATDPNLLKAKVKVTAPDAEEQFLTTITDWLAALPHDLKVLYEASDDENLPRPAREFAVGAIIAVVGGSHIPGHVAGDFANYCDSTVLLRLALKRIAGTGGEDVDFFKERFPEHFDTLDRDLSLCREVLGDAYDWIAAKADKLPELEHKGKKVPVYIDDEDASELLYEDGLEFQTEYEVDEDVLSDRLKRCQTILDAIDARMKAEGAR